MSLEDMLSPESKAVLARVKRRAEEEKAWGTRVVKSRQMGSTHAVHNAVAVAAAPEAVKAIEEMSAFLKQKEWNRLRSKAWRDEARSYGINTKIPHLIRTVKEERLLRFGLIEQVPGKGVA